MTAVVEEESAEDGDHQFLRLSRGLKGAEQHGRGGESARDRHHDAILHEIAAECRLAIFAMSSRALEAQAAA